MWGRRLAAMLALYTSKGVAPEVNLRERISRTPLHSSNKAEPTLALKPRGDVTRSPEQGYQWPHKWTCVQQKFEKKNYFIVVIHHSPILKFLIYFDIERKVIKVTATQNYFE